MEISGGGVDTKCPRKRRREKLCKGGVACSPLVQHIPLILEAVQHIPSIFKARGQAADCAGSKTRPKTQRNSGKSSCGIA